MRKFTVAAVLSMFGVAVLATPASASFDHHFSVIAKSTSQRQEGNVVRFKTKYLEPGNRDNRVGADRGRCTLRPRAEKFVCRVVIRLNGEIGGNGHLSASGDLERHDNRLNIVVGDGDFNGVAGKMLIHTLNPRTERLHFDLVR
jgi:hypothetical protein